MEHSPTPAMAILLYQVGLVILTSPEYMGDVSKGDPGPLGAQLGDVLLKVGQVGGN